jgi:cell division protein FtsB
MSTRLKHPAVFRHFLIGALLISFQAYLGYSAINGRFGIENQKQMLVDIKVLQVEKANLQTRIDAYRHRISLFDPARLDPDIITEKARALLSMAHPDDIIVVLDENS